MAKKDYTSWDRKELIREIDQLRKRKKYGLVWEDKPEGVVEQCKSELPVLEEVKNKEIVTDPDKPINLLIEGDNYHALSVLNYTHKGKIDVIYIDPPYNTGNKDFKYNDTYIDTDDAFRHSKWISFIYKRLLLAKNLLKKTGVIFISIDDNEIAQLKILCDEIFGEKNLVGMVSVAKGTTTGQDAKKFGSSVDYLLVYGMANFISGRIQLTENDRKRFSKRDEKGLYSILQFRKTGNNDRRENRPNLFYSLSAPDNTKIFPIGPTGYESTWRGDIKFYNKLLKNNMIEWVRQQDGWKPYVKFYLEGRDKAPSNLWTDIEGNKKATIELRDIFGDKIFQNPKPTDLIKRCINLANTTNPIILDFFVGSGTTAHAVLSMNAEDDGNRSFIVCTNNENNICSDICYPRIKKVIAGYNNTEGILINGTSGNLKYFKTTFVPAESTDKNKTVLTKKVTEMLCIKEDTFKQVKSNEQYVIFGNKKKYTGIIYDHQAIDIFKKEISRIDGKFSVYVFSLGDDTFEDEFEDMKKKVKLSPIPEAILRVYRRIFK